MSLASASLVRKLTSEPCPPAFARSVIPATVKLGLSSNSIGAGGVPDECDMPEEEGLPDSIDPRINSTCFFCPADRTMKSVVPLCAIQISSR